MDDTQIQIMLRVARENGNHREIKRIKKIIELNNLNDDPNKYKICDAN